MGIYKIRNWDQGFDKGLMKKGGNQVGPWKTCWTESLETSIDACFVDLEGKWGREARLEN